MRSAEMERLRALVDSDMATAHKLHAPEFQVINPLGRALSREAYLNGVASGESDYLTWEPERIDVRIAGPMAAIRYRSRVDLSVRGRRLPLMEAWNTGLYERREGRWQIVWFQVTEIGSAR